MSSAGLNALLKALLIRGKQKGTQYAPDQVRNPGAVTSVDEPIGAMSRDLDAIPAEVRQARRQARDAQGVDRLAQPVTADPDLPMELSMRAGNRAMFESEAEGGSITDHLRRTQFERSPSRLPDASGIPKKMQKSEMIEAMEQDFQYAQKEFERLAGRPPTPKEMSDIGTLEHLIDILKDASGESRVPSNNLNPLDEIPF